MTEQQPKETTSVTNTLDDLLSNPFSSIGYRTISGGAISYATQSSGIVGVTNVT